MCLCFFVNEYVSFLRGRCVFVRVFVCVCVCVCVCFLFFSERKRGEIDVDDRVCVSV